MDHIFSISQANKNPIKHVNINCPVCNRQLFEPSVIYPSFAQEQQLRYIEIQNISCYNQINLMRISQKLQIIQTDTTKKFKIKHKAYCNTVSFCISLILYSIIAVTFRYRAIINPIFYRNLWLMNCKSKRATNEATKIMLILQQDSSFISGLKILKQLNTQVQGIKNDKIKTLKSLINCFFFIYYLQFQLTQLGIIFFFFLYS
ncbi:hypothetical protein ABPG72_004208 [Tetrahymena utriculariae]